MPDIEQISDGHHTFDELYAHRNHLFVSLMRSHPEISWRARHHNDGSMFPGWFIAGMHFPHGDISYHLPIDMWELLDYAGIETSDIAAEWDGHTSKDVINRLFLWISKDKNIKQELSKTILE